MDEDVAFPTPVGLANEVRELVGRTHKQPSPRPQDPSLLSDRVHYDVNSPNIWSRCDSLIISHPADGRASCGTQRVLGVPLTCSKHPGPMKYLP